MDVALELSWQWWLILTLVAVLAGFIDAIAGGGGLLTIPALLMAGLSPVQTLATNKLQACFGSFSATYYFVRQRQVMPWRQRWAILMAAIGAVGGVLCIQRMDSQLLVSCMPYALMLIALYLLWVPLAKGVVRARLTERSMNVSAVPAIGFYDGFFGPGTGTFFMLSYSQGRGLDAIGATAQAKLLNFTTNIASLVVFISAGQIMWWVGLSMALGQAVGARFGAALALKQGAGLIRALSVVMCVLMSISLLLRDA